MSLVVIVIGVALFSFVLSSFASAFTRLFKTAAISEGQIIAFKHLKKNYKLPQSLEYQLEQYFEATGNIIEYTM